MPGRALLHELGKDARLVGRLPFAGHLPKNKITYRPALPERDDPGFVALTSLCTDGERYLLAGIEDVQILEGVAAKFRVGGGGLGGRTLLADDQLAVVEADSSVLHEVLEGQRAKQGG